MVDAARLPVGTPGSQRLRDLFHFCRELLGGRFVDPLDLEAVDKGLKASLGRVVNAPFVNNLPVGSDACAGFGSVGSHTGLGVSGASTVPACVREGALSTCAMVRDSDRARRSGDHEVKVRRRKKSNPLQI